MDLVKKKTIALDYDTYERLSKLAAQLRIDNPGGGFVSMGAAVGVLLDMRDARRMKMQESLLDFARSVDKDEKGRFVLSSPKRIENESE
jgi:hypothetical protein